MSREHDWGAPHRADSFFYPAGYIGDVQRTPRFYKRFVGLPHQLPPAQRIRFGYKRDTWQGTSAFDLGCCWNGAGSTICRSRQDHGRAFPTVNGQFHTLRRARLCSAPTGSTLS